MLQLHWEANGQMEPIHAEKRDKMIEAIVQNLKVLYEQFADVRELSLRSLQQQKMN